MEMDIYMQQSAELSLSNLAMLKAFQQAGVDVHSLPIHNYMMDVHYSSEACFDIFTAGCEGLFEDIEFIPYEHIAQYEEEVEDGISDELFVIRDQRLSLVLESKYRKEFISFIEQVSNFNYSEADIKTSRSKNELLVVIWFGIMIHEIALGVIKINDKLNELVARLEGEEYSGGVSDYIK